MNKLGLTIVALLSLWSGTCGYSQDFFSWGFSGEPKQKKVEFAYDANFDFKFDNREFDAGKEQFTESMTLFGARLTPSVGVKVNQNANISHRLMAGIDVMKEFGRSPSSVPSSSECDRGLENTRLFREITLYYGIDARLDNWRIKGYAGVFPRAFSEGDYSQAFFSDSLKFYDNNLEGLLVKAVAPRTYMEIVFDWNGKYGSYRREQFNMFGYGHYDFTKWLSAGLAFKYHHYANTEEYGSVVDDGLFQPFVKFQFAGYAGLQDLSLQLSSYLAVQQDRRQSKGQHNSAGAEITVGVRNWNVGIENRLYCGKSLYPFYNYVDDGGFKYGNNLYAGSPFYRVVPDDSGKFSYYDRFELYYQPHIADFLDLRLSIVAHLPNGFRYAGMQQKASLIFNLDKVLNPSSPRSSRSASRRSGSSRRNRSGRGSESGSQYFFGL